MQVEGLHAAVLLIVEGTLEQLRSVDCRLQLHAAQVRQLLLLLGSQDTLSLNSSIRRLDLRVRY